MRYAAIVFSLCFPCVAEEPSDKQKLPSDVQYIYNSSGKAILESYNKEKAKLIKSLQLKMDEYTKKSDLDNALIVKNLIAKVSQGQILDEISKQEKAEIDILGQDVPKTVNIVGKWRAVVGNWNHIVTISKESTGLYARTDDGSHGAVMPVGKNSMSITWNNGVKSSIEIKNGEVLFTISVIPEIGTLTLAK